MIVKSNMHRHSNVVEMHIGLYTHIRQHLYGMYIVHERHQAINAADNTGVSALWHRSS